MSNKPETKKAAKARIIAEAKAAKDAAKLAERNKVFASPLAKAVEPLKIVAVARSEIASKEWIESKLAELAAAGWDLNKIAPAPESWNNSRENYQRDSKRRASFESITSFETEKYNDQSWHDMTMPRIVKKDDAGIERRIESAKEMAALQYEAFVYKMVGKVGPHVSARLETIAGVWGESFLYVTMADGSIQKWKTQTIVNCSIYGTLFNQWPSRIVK